MRLYIQIAFWLYIGNTVAKVFYIVNNDYPRTANVIASPAEELMWMIFNLGLIVWTGSLLWGWL